MIEQVADPVCPADGAIVRVGAVGMCRSDWHAWRGHDPVPLPMVPGHEFAGVVAEVGPEVQGWQPGTRVTAPFVQACGQCEFCRQGDGQVCPFQVQPGFTTAGALAELVVVEHAEVNLVGVPSAVSLEAAAALGCRFATAFRAVTAFRPDLDGCWVAVFGCGGVGLSAVMIADALGARVVAVDPLESARTRALAAGAEHALDIGPGIAEEISDLTGGGAHLSIEAIGSPAVLADSVRSLRRRGIHVQAGLLFGPAAAAPVPMDLVVARELSIVGTHGMAAADYLAMLAMVADRRLDPERLVGRIIALEEVAETFEAMNRPSDSPGLTVCRISG